MKRKKPTPNTKENYQTTREETKKRRKDQIRTIEHQKTIFFKIALSTYLSIITLNVNKLNTALKRHMVVEWIKKKIRPIYMLHVGDSLQM